ncbi:MAG: primosomal protein N' [Bacillota bacterium]
MGYVRVLVDVSGPPGEGLYDYAVPPALEAVIELGACVRVPFRNRRALGFVFARPDRPAVTDVKEVIEVDPVYPPLTEDMRETVEFLVGRYLCSYPEALHAVLPPGPRARAEARVTLATEAAAALEAARGLEGKAPSQAAVLTALAAEEGPLSVDELAERIGGKDPGGAVKALEAQGLVRRETIWRKGVAPRLESLYALNVDATRADETARGMERRAPQQARALRALAARGTAATAAELKSLAGVSTATLTAMVAKGLVTVERAERLRGPVGQWSAAAAAAVVPTQAQGTVIKSIVEALAAKRSARFLLHGVTGSGKTEVYLRAVDATLAAGRSAIYLVPEIALTPQAVAGFRARFGDDVAVLHSRLSDGERYDEWRRIYGGKVRVAVGARSAVFAPFADLGLVVLDEEHEGSYKQEEDPRYHAREVAEHRAMRRGAVLLLGSATPSLESYHAATTAAGAGAGANRLVDVPAMQLLCLPERVGHRPLPTVTIVDLREELKAENRSVLSRLLQEKLADRLAKREQAILFLNRRGFSTFVLCRECGHSIRCPNCEVSLTYHSSGPSGPELRCHYCDFRRPVPNVCPHCGSSYIRYFGAGTERIADEVRKVFPNARVTRLDADSAARKGAHATILKAFRDGEADILVGTQMVAKGLDFPRVTLVGVVAADTALNLPDFRAAERTFQLLTQVAGRAGRGEPGEVIFQTYQPEHYSLTFARDQDFEAFFVAELEHRRALRYPPFSRVGVVMTSGTDERAVIALAEAVSARVRQDAAPGTEVLGPAPAPFARLRGRYRWQTLVKGGAGEDLAVLLRSAQEEARQRRGPGELRVTVDIDPQNLL